MRTPPAVRRPAKPTMDAKKDNAPVLVVPQQSGDLIGRRRDIREAFHDSRAVTIKAKRRQ